MQQIADERKKLADVKQPVVIHDKQPLPVVSKKVDTNIATGLVKRF